MADTRGWTGSSDRAVYALARLSGTAPPTFLSRDDPARLPDFAPQRKIPTRRGDQGVASVKA
jgi:hypothetical protein